jgi:hypothetical protein
VCELHPTVSESLSTESFGISSIRIAVSTVKKKKVKLSL